MKIVKNAKKIMKKINKFVNKDLQVSRATVEQQLKKLF